MAIRVRTGLSTWANVTELRVKTAINTWSDVIRARVQTAAGVWSDFFTATLTPTIQTRVQVAASGGISGSTMMNDSSAVTLTSTRFHWIDADGFTYIWQSSPDNSIWSDIGTAQSTTNPGSGSSSSSITKVLSGSDFTSGPDMYFRFKSMATNSTYSTSGSSESLSVLVSYYGTPTPNSPYPSITGSTTVGGTAYGNIGTWTNSPTSYDYRWFFMSGATSYPLTSGASPNPYQGTVSSSTTISLVVPTTDYSSGLNLIDKALYFGVKAYNPATLSPSEYSNYKIIYGVPVITLGTPTYPSGTQAQIPFTHSYMTSYSIDVVRAGASHTGYPTIITSSTSPINISALTAGFTYTVNVYPINGENAYGSLKTTTITLPNAPGVPTSLTRTTGNAGSKTFSWSAPSSGGTVVSYEYQLNSFGWTNNGSSTSVSLTGLSGTNVFQVRAIGSSLTGTAASTGSFTIPTINSGPSSSSVTSSSATISWTSTNQSSWSLSGVGSYSGSSQTSQSVSLSASSSYTPTLVITSSTGDTATTTGAPFSTLAQSFTVTFNANGGTGSMASQTANTATNLTAFGFTPPAGKAFSGWSTSAGGSVVYANQASYPFTSSATLYAIYYTLPTAPSAPSPSVTSGPTQTTATVSWSAPANGGSAITSYEAQLGSSGYVNIGNVLSSSISGLTASTSYTYYVRAINAVGTSSAGSVSFTTLAAPVPSVTQIQSTNTNAGPTFMSFAITCSNALSCDVRVDRAASSPTPPTSSYTAGTSTLLTLSGGSGTVNSTTSTPPAGSNAWYRIRVIPYTGASRTGTAGTQVASSWKRNTVSSTTTTNPSPTPFGDASI